MHLIKVVLSSLPARQEAELHLDRQGELQSQQGNMSSQIRGASAGSPSRGSEPDCRWTCLSAALSHLAVCKQL